MKVAIVGGTRTPFVKAGGVFAKYSTLDLGLHVVTSCIKKLPFDPSLIDELFFGTVLLDPRVPNLAREIVLRSGLPKSITGHFVGNNCITGLLAAAAAQDGISAGRISVALAGGAESMSQPSLTFPSKGERFFIKLSKAKSVGERLSLLTSFRPSFVFPQAPSPKEPSTGLTMGQHCELMAQQMSITRAEQDKIALQSHIRAAQAIASGAIASQIEPLGGIAVDNLVRGESSLEKLAALPAVFDKGPGGSISAGNSSALTDGASVVCIMREEVAKERGVPVLGYLEAVEFASVPPGDGLLMGPALAVPKVLAKTGDTFQSLALFEIHEAFGAQVLCNMKAWKEGWSNYPSLAPLGEIPEEKLNIFGGSIALGHPFAATGGRLLLNACDALRSRGGGRALISVCAAGGGAAAAIVSV
jgi:acetyl-CoA acetyltransferase family protein